MAKFSENRHISDLINMSCKVVYVMIFSKLIGDRNYFNPTLQPSLGTF